MKEFTKIVAVLACLALNQAAGPVNAQEAAAPTPQAEAEAAPRPASKLSPKQQITGFYAMCKQGRGGEGLTEMLSTNPVVKPDDVQKVAGAFSQLIEQMGAFVDFKVVKETEISERTQVVRCVAHFDRQPFVNEFTFYDPGSGDWRLVHLRYDANLATMFQEDVRPAQ